VLSDAELFEAMSKRTAATIEAKQKELMAAQVCVTVCFSLIVIFFKYISFMLDFF
jgi:hypothetical protein